MAKSIVRYNLMVNKGYSPYCGNNECSGLIRTFFNGSQFECKICGWTSSFPARFIKKYIKKWNIEIKP